MPMINRPGLSLRTDDNHFTLRTLDMPGYNGNLDDLRLVRTLLRHSLSGRVLTSDGAILTVLATPELFALFLRGVRCVRVTNDPDPGQPFRPLVELRTKLQGVQGEAELQLVNGYLWQATDNGLIIFDAQCEPVGTFLRDHLDQMRQFLERREAVVLGELRVSAGEDAAVLIQGLRLALTLTHAEAAQLMTDVEHQPEAAIRRAYMAEL